eukprot:1141137-Pelagomonas_calceolata.AAC.3
MGGDDCDEKWGGLSSDILGLRPGILGLSQAHHDPRPGDSSPVGMSGLSAPLQAPLYKELRPNSMQGQVTHTHTHTTATLQIFAIANDQQQDSKGAKPTAVMTY